MSEAPAVQVVAGPLDDTLRRELIYDGALLIFKEVEPLRRLCGFTDSFIRETLGTSDPVRAQFELEAEAYEGKVGALQKRYTKAESAKSRWM